MRLLVTFRFTTYPYRDINASGLLSNEQDICSVEAGSAEDIDKAVAAARAALNHESWRDISGTERGRLMFKLADLAEQEKEVLATIETWDNGKPYGDALGDLGEVVDCIRYYAGWADKIYGQTIPTTAQKFAYTLKQPIGVCGQIIPVSWIVTCVAAATCCLKPLRDLGRVE